MSVATRRRPGAAERIRGLEFNSVAMVASGLANSVLGLVFWAVAARLFPASEVGVAGALINTAVMLATLSNLSLGPLYERFLPQAGARARGAILTGSALTITLAVVIGTGFVLLGPRNTLFASATAAAAFPVCVAVLAAFSLADSILIGLRVARWAAAKNIFHAVAKLVVLVVLGATGSALSGSSEIIVSWIVPAAVAVVVVQAIIAIAGRALPSRSNPTLPPTGELWTYFGSSLAITALSTVTPLALPLIVVVSAGNADTAYFTIAWTIVAAVLMAPGYIAGPFIAEAAACGERLAELLRRFLRLLLLVTVASTAAMALCGPVALRLVGADYLAGGWRLLLLMSLVPIVGAPSILYAVLCRVHRTMRIATILQVASTIGIVAVSWALVPRVGVVGVGYTFVIVETLISLACLAPLMRLLRTDRGAAPANSAEVVGPS